MKAIHQPRIIHHSGFINLALGFIGKENLVILHFYLADLFLLCHSHESAVIHLLDTALFHIRHQHKIDHKKHCQND